MAANNASALASFSNTITDSRSPLSLLTSQTPRTPSADCANGITSSSTCSIPALRSLGLSSNLVTNAYIRDSFLVERSESPRGRHLAGEAGIPDHELGVCMHRPPAAFTVQKRENERRH